MDPAGCLPFDLGRTAPDLGVSVDELGLVQADGRFHQLVVQGVPDGADRGCDAGVTEGLGERDGERPRQYRRNQARLPVGPQN